MRLGRLHTRLPKWSRFGEIVGARIRLWRVRNAVASIGQRVMIEPGVTLRCPERIAIGDEAKLYRGVCLNARSDERDIAITLGRGVKIHEYSYVDSYGGHIQLDEFVGIGHHCVIGGHGGLRIGRYSMIAGLSYIVPANHRFDRRDIPYVQQGETRLGITIGENVWVGAGTIILDGVSIGDNTIIGAGSVVTRSLGENVLAFGSPAQVVKVL